MVPHDGQYRNVGKISRVERAVCVGDQGVGNHTTPGKQIAYRGLFPRKTGFSSAEINEPGKQTEPAREIGRVGRVRGQAGFPACLRGRPIFKRVKELASNSPLNPITPARNGGLDGNLGTSSSRSQNALGRSRNGVVFLTGKEQKWQLQKSRKASGNRQRSGK